MNLPFSPRQIKFIFIAGGVLLFLIGGIIFGLRNVSKKTEVVLTVWGTPEEKEAILAGAAGFQPSDTKLSATINFVSLDSVNYENEMLDRLAEGQAPDVIMINNHWIPKHKNKLVSLDSQVFSPAKLVDFFPRAVEDDFVNQGAVYALPLYLDTLALFYNKNLFDQAGIVAPPKTWRELQQMIPQLRVVNAQGQIVRAAVALGGSEKSVVNATDILPLLMIQNGSGMINTKTFAENFNVSPLDEESRVTTPGVSALDFYVQFANAGSPYYTWNDNQVSSLDSFASSKVAMVFAYQSQIATIKNKNQFLRFGVAPMLQISDNEPSARNYPHYWGLAVSKQSSKPDMAWDFIYYLTTTSASAYNAVAGHPPVLRSQIATLLDDSDYGVFARQALTARSWYVPDSDKIKTIFNNAISRILLARVGVQEAFSELTNQVSQIIIK